MNPILAALLNVPPPTGASTSSPSSTDPGSAATFKSQFDQAVATLTNAPGQSAQGTTATTAALADTLTETLQKKITDLLAKGESVSEIVQQLAASLASLLVPQFGGDAAQIQAQLQTAFTSVLSPPTTGPPLSNTDLASALAQRFRLVAGVAAGVLGETGQPNRLFAGSISDAATTAGVQPAPQPTDHNSLTADSVATDATAFLASLSASRGDGKAVATNGAPALGPNGDTLLGRILARATRSQQGPTGPQAPIIPVPAETSRLSILALAAAAPVGFGATAQAASAQQAAAQASSGVRCFMSAHTDAQHESTGGWVCFPQYHSSSARQS